MGIERPQPNAPYACLGNLLVDYLERDGLTIKDFLSQLIEEAKMQNMGSLFTLKNYNQVQNWTKGRHKPSKLEHYVVLSNVTGQPVQTLLCRKSPFSANWTQKRDPYAIVIKNIGEYRDRRSEIILSAQERLVIQLRTAHFIEEYTYELLEIMRRGVRVQLLSCDPDDPATKTMLVRRKYALHSDIVSVERQIHGAFADIRKDMRANHISDKQLEIRVIPYLPSTAIYIADPKSPSATLFAVTALYKVHPYCASVIIAEREQHPDIYNTFLNQFMALWRDSRKYTGAKTKEEKEAEIRDLANSLLSAL
ncbi:MAG: hypothetical protein J0M07_01325 [Anaerolineae bacterium]|nr:hypothetical protein [Anaerolineae bacterium]